MKRHQKLQDLSREHYSALKLALQAKRAVASGDPAQIETAAAACVADFESALDPHFVIEENTLLPMLSGTGEAELVRQILHDHAALRLLASQLRQPDATKLLGFAELLMAHVRFEERDMFPAVEAHLSAIGAA